MKAKRNIKYVVCRFVPPDHHEDLEEFDDIMVAEFRTYQLDADLSPEQKRAGIFHYRWVRIPEDSPNDWQQT